MEIIEFINNNKILKEIIIIVIALFVYIVIGKLIDNATNKFIKNKKVDNKTKTLIKVLVNIAKYVFLLFVILTILQLNGINISALLTGVGVIGVVGGVALQDILKDLVMGTNIMVENFFHVGDIVKYNNYVGKVISFGLKSTKIQSIENNDIISIANRNITEVSKVSRWLDIDVPVSYDDKIEIVEKVFDEIISKINELDNVEKCEYKGLSNFASSSIDYKIRINCNPEFKLQTRRDALRIIKTCFDKHKISIPYTQIDIHTK